MRGRHGRGRGRGSRLLRAVGRIDSRLISVLLLAGGLAPTVLYPLLPRGRQYKAGDIAVADVFAPRPVSWTDEEATQALRQQAIKSVPKVYDPARPQAQQETTQRANSLFERIEATADLLRRLDEADSGTPAPTTATAESAPKAVSRSPDAVMREAWDGVDERYRPAYDTFASVVRTDQAARAALRSACGSALQRLNESLSLRDDEPDENRSKVTQKLSEWAEMKLLALPPGGSMVALFVEICAACVAPNETYNAEATERDRAAVADAVMPVTRTIKRGQLVVSQGSEVTAEVIQALRQLGLMETERLDWTAGLLTVLMAYTCVGLGFFLLSRYEPENLTKGRRFALASGLLLVAALGMNVMRDQDSAPYASFALAEFVALVGTVLLGHFAAAALCGIVLVLFSLIVGASSTLVLLSVLLGAAAGIASARYLTYRLLHVAALGVLSGLFALVSVGFVEFYYSLRADGVYQGQSIPLWTWLRWALTAGLVGVFGGYFGNRCLELPLETVTDMRLLELSDPSHPLLESLLSKAPGTYHGSLLVSSLAGNAAKALGHEHDALLLRVGAMYHDVGKTVRPHMFVENQMPGHNPHDSLSPALSARSIVAHVTEGVDLAEEHHLPRPIIDCIREHHGRTLVAYFYRKALEQGIEGLTEEQFRYPGPKPQSAATGILMLADACEAAVRALPAPTRNAIETTVGKVVDGKIEDGQLDECPLTMKEIKAAERSLISSLLGIFHARVEYPEAAPATAREEPAPGTPSADMAGAQAEGRVEDAPGVSLR